MTILGVLLILLLNGFISYWNLYVVGKCWAESKMAGGWQHFLTWCTAIMGICGLTYCYLIPVTFLASVFHILPQAYAMGAFELGYLIIILPVLGTGLAMWLESVQVFYRERDFTSGAVATYNTYAQFHNMYCAAEAIPSIFSDLGSLVNKTDGDNNALALMVIIVLIVLGAGVLTGVKIIQHSAKDHGKSILDKINKTKQS